MPGILATLARLGPGMPLAASLGAGCAGELADRPPTEVRFAERDSAGVRIAENGPGVPERWALSPEPRLRIGMVDGPAEYVFGRVSGAALLADGRVVVADAGSDELRIYSADGVFLARAGRRGEGPGEFRQITWLGVAGADTLVVFDRPLRRVTVVGPDGRYLRSWPVLFDLEWSFPSVLALQADGSLLVAAHSNPSRARSSEGFGRDTVFLVRVPPDRQPADTLAAAVDADAYLRVLGNGQTMYLRVRRPFGGSVLAAGTRGGYVLADGDRYELAIRSSDGGTVRRIVRREVPVEAVTAEDVERYRRGAGAASANAAMRRYVREAVARLEPGRTKPPIQSLRFGSDGGLRVERFRFPDDTVAVWDVYSPDGRLRAEVRFPARLEIQQLGPDHVVAVERDEWDASYVTVYDVTARSRRR